MSIANLFNSRRATRHLYARVVVVRHRSPRPHGRGPCTRPRDATGRRLLASRSYGCSEDELYNETRTHLSLDKMLRSVARSSDMRPLSLCRFCQDSIITYRRSRHSNFQPHSRRHPTSPRCPSAWQPNPGRRSTYRRGKIVQTTGTGTLMAVASSMVLMRCSDFTSTVGCAAALPPPGPIPICQGDILRMSFLRCRSTNSEPSPVLVLCCRRSIRQTRPINGSELHSS